MTQIIRAEHAGFCFGVRQAIEKAQEYIEKAAGEGKKIYACGSLIHNQMVTQALYEKGLREIDRPQEAEEGAWILVRSHGEPPDFYEACRERSLFVIDGTCPFVARIHRLVSDAAREGYQVILVGDCHHPEVAGINGWCGNNAWIADSAEVFHEMRTALRAVLLQQPDGARKLFLAAQTTSRRDVFEDIRAEAEQVAEEVGAVLQVENTICSATAERQEAAASLSKTCDCMIVIGDPASSNSRKLYEISNFFCKNTHFIESFDYLGLKEIEKCNRIGITAGASTPEPVIMEVIAKMSDNITENKEVNEMNDFMEEIEKSTRLPRNGEIVEGTVLQVSDKELTVNLGCKKDGVIPADEITLEGDQKLTDLYKEGDVIQAKVLSHDNGDGNILLSKKKVEVNEHWDEVSGAMDEKQRINVKVLRQVNGGVIAAYKEVTGFIPLSQLSERFVESAEEFISKVLTVKVTRVDRIKNRAVFSHKAVLVEERQARLDEIWNSIHVDDIVEGTVMRFTEYGAFIDIGGIDGLLHISEISWGKLKNPQDVLQIGQKINVKVLSMNREKGKISLGLKQTQPEPWSVIDDKYHINDVVSGKVVQIKEYGAFVELEPGLDGLVHISEVAHKRVTNIQDEISVGQEVQAKILDIDRDKKRISLSIKETVDKPLFEDTKAKAVETVAAAKADMAEAFDEAREKAAELKEKAAQKLDAVKEEIAGKVEDIKDAVKKED